MIISRKMAKILTELDKCRTSVMVDGWQSSRYAKKARKWDILAQEKMRLIGLIDESEGTEQEKERATYGTLHIKPKTYADLHPSLNPNNFAHSLPE